MTGQAVSSRIQKLEEKMAILEDELETLKDAAHEKVGELCKQINDQSSATSKLSDALKGTLNELERIDICKFQTSFTFEVKSLGSLIAAGPKENRGSELFYCAGET